MTNRRIRNARLTENAGFAIHDQRSPVREEVMEHHNTGVQWVRDIHAAHDVHVSRKLRGM